MGTSRSKEIALKLRNVATVLLITSSFICGFYFGEVKEPYATTMNTMHPLFILSNQTESGLQTNLPMDSANNSIKSNYMDEIFEWQYLKNRNTELSPYYVQKHQIIFCGIPKNAVSMWKMLLLRMNGLEWFN